MTQPTAFTEERTDPDREALRRQHQVRLVDAKEDGTGLHRLPNGVYGYTYSPGLSTTPLFRKSGAHMFEVHKSADGEVLILGCVTPAQIALLRDASDEFDLSIYPGPRDASTELAAVPMSRVIRIKQLTIRETGALEQRIGPR